MNTFKGYINYGCLAAEKRPVYTAENPHHTAKVSEEVMFTIPDGWELDKGALDNLIVTAPCGWNYIPNDLLGGKEFPCFTGIDKNGNGFNIKLDYKLL